jgi:hypothetical protein
MDRSGAFLIEDVGSLRRSAQKEIPFVSHDTLVVKEQFIKIGDLIYFFSDEEGSFCYGDGYAIGEF